MYNVRCNKHGDEWKQRGHELDEHRQLDALAIIFVVPVKDTVEKIPVMPVKEKKVSIAKGYRLGLSSHHFSNLISSRDDFPGIR